MQLNECARVDWSAVGMPALRTRMLTLIQGRIRPRTTGLSLRQIERTFAGTPKPFIAQCLNDLLTDMLIDIRRTTLGRATYNSGYVYFAKGRG